MQRFVRKYVQRYKPIPADADVSVETWLENTNSYTQARKDELMKCWKEHNCQITKKDLDVASFGKLEDHEEYKNARGINSRSDPFKCASGPFFKLMEAEVYQDPAFIKHVPVCERPKYITDMLGSYEGPYYETDYSQFEKHFTKEILMNIEMVLYAHLLQNHSGAFDLIRHAMTGTNACHFAHFVLYIEARRMSGEMCTSLGNGFTNLMLAKFIAHEKGGHIVGVVEGDDGLFYSTVSLTPDDFKQLGFQIKMIEHTNLLRTSFCGLVMSADLITMTDPCKVLLNFGWTHSAMLFGGAKVKLGLLRAKALSLAYEHPRCPILHALAARALKLTEGAQARFESTWYESQLNSEVQTFKNLTQQQFKLGPSAQSRRDFSELFGIPINQQYAVEKALGKITLGEIDDPVILALFGSHRWDDARDYYVNFTHYTKQGVFP